MSRERIYTALLWTVAMAVCALLSWILVNLFWRGSSSFSLAFLSEAPRDAGRAGGIASLLVSTFWIVGTATLVALPIGLFSAVLLAEGASRRVRFTGTIHASLDMLNAVPSIVFGLFGNAFFCVTLGMGYSILSGALTLACMILPILIRTIEESLRAVPAEQRQAALALGLSRTTTLWRVLLPAAAPGIAVALVLGIGRALSETAALIFTAGYVTRFPDNLLDSGRALSVHIYDLAMNVPGGDARAYTTAFVLVVVLLALNSSVRLAARHFTSRQAT